MRYHLVTKIRTSQPVDSRTPIQPHINVHPLSLMKCVGISSLLFVYMIAMLSQDWLRRHVGFTGAFHSARGLHGLAWLLPASYLPAWDSVFECEIRGRLSLEHVCRVDGLARLGLPQDYPHRPYGVRTKTWIETI